LTSAGVVVLAASIAFGVLAWVLGYRAFGVLSVGGLVALAIAGVVALAAPELHVERAVEPARVSRGQPAHGIVSVRNVGRRRSAECLAVEPVGAEIVDVAIPSLGSQRSVAVPYQLPTRRRGVVSVGPLWVRRRDPFALWQTTHRVGSTQALLVEPMLHALDPRPAGRARHLDGPVSDTAPRGTLTFHSLREYVPGDDIRRVHWRTTARTGTLMVREHVDTSQPSTVVVLDVRSNSYQSTADVEAFEEAVDLAASVVVSSQAVGFPVRLVTTDGVVRKARAGQRGQELRDFLATVQALPAAAALGMQRAAMEVARGREHDALVVISGRVESADLAQCSLMARRFATSVLLSVQPPTGMRWGGGVHVLGDTAADIVAQWRAGAVSRIVSLEAS
jgi:uncharacterized protein (DUF58 family)